jgi:NADPH2:quinone reductase
MRAVVYSRFGPPDVLRLTEAPIPTPKHDEVLIRIHATTVTSAETAMRQGRPLWGRVIIGFTRPRRSMRTLGIELSGEVAAVGRDVTRFRAGDQVYGFAGFSIGANADYLCLPAKASLAIKPANTTFAQAAAAVDGATTSLYFLRDKAHVQPGQRVLVIGASGSIGTYAVQLAKHFGAHVTGVCSTRNIALVTELGADAVVDYTREDFTQGAQRYDIVFDTVGKSSFRACRKVLAPGGCYVPTTGPVSIYLSALWTALRPGPKVKVGMSVEKNEALVFLRDLIESDKLRIIIDRVYPLDEIVEAHRYVDQGRKRGNVVVSLVPEEG